MIYLIEVSLKSTFYVDNKKIAVKAVARQDL